MRAGINPSPLDEILTKIELMEHRQSTWILFAIIDKVSMGMFVEMIGLIRTSPANLSAELG